MKGTFAGRKLWWTLLVLAGLAGIAYWQRQPVLAWYHVRQLSYAYQNNREACANKVAALEEAAWPSVFAEMRKDDAIVCGNMQYALYLMAKAWGIADPRTQQLVERLHLQYDEFSPAGREKVLMLLTGLLQLEGPRPAPAPFTKVVSDVLLMAEKQNELRTPSLLLAAELVEAVQPGQWVDVCRDMAERGLKDAFAGTRVAAVQLVLREPMRNEKELIAQMVPLLRDPELAVRKAVVIALASESDSVREEHFLPLLHDSEAEVQFLSEMALRKRGLGDDDIAIARDLGDSRPATRMRVLHRVGLLREVNLSALVRRLSQDPEPAVRAAAVRAAGENPHLNLADRLREMAEGDPSDVVRSNARHYLQEAAALVPR